MAIVLDGTNGVTTNSGTLISATTIGVGGATPSASGSGITFPATQSASTDANTLDDYEEGTWTPNVGGNATYTGQLGVYVKIGRLVYASFDITVNVIGTGSTTTLSGFPFTSTGAGFPYTGSVSYFASIATSVVFVSFYVQNSATSCLFTAGVTSGTTITQNAFPIFGNSARVIGSVCYQSAS